MSLRGVLQNREGRATSCIYLLDVLVLAPLDHRRVVLQRQHVVAQNGRKHELYLVSALVQKFRYVVDVAAVPDGACLDPVHVEFRYAVLDAELHVRAALRRHFERRRVDDASGK